MNVLLVVDLLFLWSELEQKTLRRDRNFIHRSISSLQKLNPRGY